MDSQTLTTMIFGILGGLGIFLLGMKNMSEGMQAVAGNRLRKLINAITNNRLIACGVGTIATCLVQSSSITTVMVVGMVNAGIMNLVQAIGVILGANIGTTITGWILVIKIGKYGLPILGISALFYLFTKHERIRYTAGICLGLGMIFFGLQLMKNGFSPLKDMPAFTEWFARFSPTGYFGVLKCCLVGAVLTAIVQSSSATLAITMGLAYSGVIDHDVQSAGPINRSSNKPFHIVFNGDVRRDSQRFAAGRNDLVMDRAKPLLRTGSQRHPHTTLGQPQGKHTSNPATGARHNSNPAVNLISHLVPFLFDLAPATIESHTWEKRQAVMRRVDY